MACTQAHWSVDPVSHCFFQSLSKYTFSSFSQTTQSSVFNQNGKLKQQVSKCFLSSSEFFFENWLGIETVLVKMLQNLPCIIDDNFAFLPARRLLAWYLLWKDGDSWMDGCHTLVLCLNG